MRLLILGNVDTVEHQRLRSEARSAGHEATVSPVEDVVFDFSESGFSATLAGRELLESFDCLLLRSLFPLVSESLMLAEMFHRFGCRVMDRTLATDTYIQSKTYSAWRLHLAGLPVPFGIQTGSRTEIDRRLNRGDWPIVVKSVHGSRGERVHLARDRKEAEAALAAESEWPCLLQEKLKIETEYRVLVLGHRVLGAITKEAPDGDFRRNLSLGGRAEPAKLTEEISGLCELAARTLDYEFAGVDLAVTEDGRTVILEVNRTPGFAGFEAATGDNVARKVIDYLAG
ncbi:MAG: RimK family alpha-L-glutamate ligase [bacterium]